MTKKELRERLDELNVNASAYSVDGELVDEAYVVDHGVDGWIGYYSEHGARSGLQRFSTEEDAYEWLYAALLGDPTTRVR